MAQKLREWIETEVEGLREKPLSWLSQYHFFRDPSRPTYSDSSLFFSPADGIILYQETVAPGECIVDIKGRPYSLREAMQDESYDKRSLVIGIFMTFFDVHVNRIPFSGRLFYRPLEPIDTVNYPMLDVEKSILDDLRVAPAAAEYLHHNERVLNRIDATALGLSYYVLQVADYDVDSITPFELKQNQPCYQGERFSQIRYGSQVDLIIPCSPGYELETLQDTGVHVEAGLDPLVAVRPRRGAASDNGKPEGGPE